MQRAKVICILLITLALGGCLEIKTDSCPPDYRESGYYLNIRTVALEGETFWFRGMDRFETRERCEQAADIIRHNNQAAGVTCIRRGDW